MHSLLNHAGVDFVRGTIACFIAHNYNDLTVALDALNNPAMMEGAAQTGAVLALMGAGMQRASARTTDIQSTELP